MRVGQAGDKGPARPGRRRHHWCTLAFAGILASGCAARGADGVESVEPVVLDQRPGLVTSNVLRSDYAGSAACARCHPKLHQAWQSSPMRNMTRRVEGARVHAPFDGRVFRFRGDEAIFQTMDGARYLSLRSHLVGNQVYRITKIIGGRNREDFVGLRVDRPGKGHRVLGDPRNERVLPVSWLIFDATHRYKGYSVQTPERDGLKPGAVWRKTCIFCHNTPHYLATLYDDLHGPGARTYQGHVSDGRLPSNRLWGVRVRDVAGLLGVLAREIERLRGQRYQWPQSSLPRRLRTASEATEARYTEADLVELGIGCEACHGGSRAHVAEPRLRPSFAPRSPLLEALPPPGKTATRAGWINRTCRRCHTVLFTGYAYTWEGGLVRTEPGGSTVNSGEARNLQLGGCADQIACTACHDPHRRDDPAHLTRLQTPAGNGVCVTCHPALRGAAALARHSHHRPEGAGGSCVACHLPRKNLGLRYALTAYHRIGKPTDPARVLRDRPLECALCHPDASVERLITTMERWWPRRYDRAALRQLYGPDLTTPVLDATLRLGKPHEQGVAVAVLGEHRRRRALPLLIDQLANPIPLVRHFARLAVERTWGRPLSLDMTLPGAALRQAALRQVGPSPPAPR